MIENGLQSTVRGLQPDIGTVIARQDVFAAAVQSSTVGPSGVEAF
jgi:hypothetical protein